MLLASAREKSGCASVKLICWPLNGKLLRKLLRELDVVPDISVPREDMGKGSEYTQESGSATGVLNG